MEGVAEKYEIETNREKWLLYIHKYMNRIKEATCKNFSRALCFIPVSHRRYHLKVEEDRKRLEARYILTLRINWIDRFKNMIVLKRVESKRNLMKDIQNRRDTLIEHIVDNVGLVHYH